MKSASDEHYTPPRVYAAVKAWARPLIEGRPIVRPFWKGADYASAVYPERCVVVDNPPFSRLTEILRFYQERRIDFLLFAPASPSYMRLAVKGEIGMIIPGVHHIRYADGFDLVSVFVTSLAHGVFLSPALGRAIDQYVDEAGAKPLSIRSLVVLASHGAAGSIDLDGVEYVEGERLKPAKPWRAMLGGSGCEDPEGEDHSGDDAAQQDLS